MSATETCPSTAVAFQRRRGRRVVLFASLSVLLVLAAIISITLGQYRVDILEIPRILAAGPLTDDMTASVVWRIRLPRLILGLLVGAALGVAGALMQAVFANPLAEPSVIGVTSGAGVGAALVIVLGLNFLGTSTIPFVAFVTAAFTTAVVYWLARNSGRVHVVNLILTGIAVNAVCGAVISFLVFAAPTTSREQIIFWQMGSLNGVQWQHVSVVAIIVAAGCLLAPVLSRRLDVLALSDRAAGHIGLNVARLRLMAILLSTMLTAGAVAYAGLIGFVGLIVPHIIRTITGPSNVVLIPASMMGGAVLISFSDLAARTIIPFADLPIGIFTALVGGPVFFILLRRMMRKGVH